MAYQYLLQPYNMLLDFQPPDPVSSQPRLWKSLVMGKVFPAPTHLPSRTTPNAVGLFLTPREVIHSGQAVFSTHRVQWPDRYSCD